MSDLIKRMKKASTIDGTSLIKDADCFDVVSIPTAIPILNVAFSGKFDGGLTSGITMLAGESRTFKTGFLIQMAKGFQDKHADGIVLFYDSEFSPVEYWETAGCDMDRIIHSPITTVEQLKHDMAVQLSGLSVNDNVLVIVDSIGGLASRKEAEDAIKTDAQPVDMTRAKALNSLFRIVTPHLNIKKIPMVLINSYYETQEMYSKRVYAGGKKVFLACDDVFFVSRAKAKDGAELAGHFFNITADKSRTIKEGSKFPVKVTWEDGVDRYSHLFELAKEAGIIHVAGAWVKTTDLATGELSVNKRANAIEDSYYEELLKHQPFCDFVEAKYLLG